MTAPDVAGARLHVDTCIEAYVGRCRQRIPLFIEGHFSLEQTWRLQHPSLWHDLLIGPLNSMWAIPYVALTRACEGLDALGVTRASVVLRAIPPGVKTGYQKAIEATIARDLLEWDLTGASADLPRGLREDLERHPALRDSAALRAVDAGGRLRTTLAGFSSGRALVSSISGTVLTVMLAWLAFGTTSLGLTDMADRIARRNARNRAASRFVLGRPAGRMFYSVFRPNAGAAEALMILVLLAGVVAVGVMICTVLSDPIRKRLGLHQRRLTLLIDHFERDLLLLSQRTIKPGLEAL